MGKPIYNGFQFQVAYIPALAVGCSLLSALAATHCAARQTHPTYAPASHTMAFTAQCSLAKTHCFSSKYYQVLIATHLPTPEGWKAEFA